jgi:hypothetical protein
MSLAFFQSLTFIKNALIDLTLFVLFLILGFFKAFKKVKHEKFHIRIALHWYQGPKVIIFELEFSNLRF